MRYVPVRPRPPVTLLRHYRNPWKAAYHHFQRYSDIRVKGKLPPHHRLTFILVVEPLRTDESRVVCCLSAEEKKGTLQDMANQRGVACRAQGWKIHLCAAQLRQLVSADLRPSTSQYKLLFTVVMMYFNGLSNGTDWAEKLIRFHLAFHHHKNKIMGVNGLLRHVLRFIATFHHVRVQCCVLHSSRYARPLCSPDGGA